MQTWFNNLDARTKRYFNPRRSFHIVYGDGTGGISLLIRKANHVWLYRLLRFGEISRFVTDSKGTPLVFNKIDFVIKVLRREAKVYAKYNHNFTEEWPHAKYNEAWFGKMYGGGVTTERALIQDPYHFWVKGYKAHFVLENATSKREHLAYYKPLNLE